MRNAWREMDFRLSATPRRKLEERLPRVYRYARQDAARGLADHGEPEAADTLPLTCPYTLDQLLGEDWLPDPAGRVNRR